MNARSSELDLAQASWSSLKRSFPGLAHECSLKRVLGSSQTWGARLSEMGLA